MLGARDGRQALHAGARRVVRRVALGRCAVVLVGHSFVPARGPPLFSVEETTGFTGARGGARDAGGGRGDCRIVGVRAVTRSDGSVAEHSGVRARVLETDAAFFAALLARDAERLAALLAADFAIVDVARGGVTGRDAFIGFVASGAAAFESIDTRPEDALVRVYGDVAIVIGETAMRFAVVGGPAFAAKSRYTHVFVHDAEYGWQLASAQGTPIASA